MRERLLNRIREMANPSKRSFRIVICSLGVLALAWQQIEATRLGYRVENARKRIHVLHGRIGALERDVQTSLSPAQLALQARARLGMQPASPDTLRILSGDAPVAPIDSFLLRLLARTLRSLSFANT